MSISEKLDAVVTTDTLNRIGEATVKAFGSATDMAKYGAGQTVEYIWAEALVASLLLMVVAAFLFTIGAVAFKKINYKTFGERDMFGNYVSLFICYFVGLVLLGHIVVFLPRVINPTGYLIYTALEKRF